jgi:hypothetical protein
MKDQDSGVKERERDTEREREREREINNFFRYQFRAPLLIYLPIDGLKIWDELISVVLCDVVSLVRQITVLPTSTTWY